jgi:hypothetical protein
MSGMSQRLGAVWARYSKLLQTRPHATNALTSATIVSMGDYIAQYTERERAKRQALDGAAMDADTLQRQQSRPIASYRSDHYEPKRTAIFATFVLFATPAWVQVYKLGDRLITGSRSLKHAYMQGFFNWCIGQSVNPLFIFYVTSASAYWVHGLRDPGLIWETYVERMQRNFLTQAAVSLCFWGSQWPILFYYLPPHLRIFYTSWLQIGWNGVVSYIIHRD